MIKGKAAKSWYKKYKRMYKMQNIEIMHKYRALQHVDLWNIILLYGQYIQNQITDNWPVLTVHIVTCCFQDVYISRPEVIKLFSWSTQLRMKPILLINVKISTLCCSQTFISRINTTSECLKAKQIVVSHHFSFYYQFNFHAQLSWAWKSFLTSVPDLRGTAAISIPW